MLEDRIAVLMSGGVDSSVAAAILKEQGCDLIGLTYNIGRSTVNGRGTTGAPAGRCCGIHDMTDAATVAYQLGIPHYVVNVSESFKREIIDSFVDGYLSGETPLPCARCNTLIKWGEMLRAAGELGASKIATGHYAQVIWDEKRKRYVLLRALDGSKDQSYFLFGLTQSQLARAVFPLGGMTKTEARARAETLGLVVSDKKDSQELCFVSEGRYSDVLESHASRRSSLVGSGPIVDTTGLRLGRHDGYYKFTVGQRSGLGLSGGPYYVREIDPGTRTVIVGRYDELLSDHLTAREPNLIGYESWDEVGRVKARIRYRNEGEWGSVKWDGDKLQVEFENPVRAVAPGQAVVFYQNDEVVGGAWIES